MTTDCLDVPKGKKVALQPACWASLLLVSVGAGARAEPRPARLDDAVRTAVVGLDQCQDGPYRPTDAAKRPLSPGGPR